MSCVLYHNGKQHLVKAEFVSHMLSRGFTSDKNPKVDPPKEPTKKASSKPVKAKVNDKD